MLTFLAIRTSISLCLIQLLPSHKVAGSCSMQDVQSCGHPICRHKLLCPLLRLNTSPCLDHYKTYFPLCFWYKKFARRVFKSSVPSPMYCKVFKDNSGALELARPPKLHPCTKHINVCYHHFCKHVRNRFIKIFPVGTENQIADALTKALPMNVFQQHRRYMCGL
jgi:hypothetical protein